RNVRTRECVREGRKYSGAAGARRERATVSGARRYRDWTATCHVSRCRLAWRLQARIVATSRGGATAVAPDEAGGDLAALPIQIREPRALSESSAQKMPRWFHPQVRRRQSPT